ncbi:MAG: type II toxin-antitoxin system Phd/YefM family antitoxin [Deltaproteobacteria bacterium]|nr:type II toxin-antitoxin system Phd/YefM family antitoxin [Deltaproteobacteria bacterium]
MSRTIGVSEARRLLPRLVESVARDGGRVDITRRGQPSVSIVRTADLQRRAGAAPGVAPSLAVELRCTPDELLDAIRQLRADAGHPRPVEPSRRRERRR